MEKNSTSSAHKRPRRNAAKRHETFGYYNWHSCQRTDSLDNLVQCKNDVWGLYFCVPCMKNMEPRLSNRDILDRDPRPCYVWKGICRCQFCDYYKIIECDEDEFIADYYPVKRHSTGRKPVTRQSRRKKPVRYDYDDQSSSNYDSKELQCQRNLRHSKVNYNESDSEIGHIDVFTEEHKNEKNDSVITRPSVGIKKVFTYERTGVRKSTYNKPDSVKSESRPHSPIKQESDVESCFEDAEEDEEEEILATQRPENVTRIDDFIILTRFQYKGANGPIADSSDDEEEPKVQKDVLVQPQKCYNNEVEISRKRDLKMEHKEKLKYKQDDKADFVYNQSRQHSRQPINMMGPQMGMNMTGANSTTFSSSINSNAIRNQLPSLSNSLAFGDGRVGLQVQNNSFKLPGMNQVRTMQINDMTSQTLTNDQPISNNFNPFKRTFVSNMVPNGYGNQVYYTTRPMNVWPQVQNGSYGNYMMGPNKLFLKATSSHQIIQIPVSLLSFQGHS